MVRLYLTRLIQPYFVECLKSLPRLPSGIYYCRYCNQWFELELVVYFADIISGIVDHHFLLIIKHVEFQQNISIVKKVGAMEMSRQFFCDLLKCTTCGFYSIWTCIWKTILIFTSNSHKCFKELIKTNYDSSNTHYVTCWYLLIKTIMIIPVF